MFGIGLPELILILALALIVVGPDKLPDLARSVAKGILELKKTANTLKESLTEEGSPLADIKPELEQAAKALKKDLLDGSEETWNTPDRKKIYDPRSNEEKDSSEIIDVEPETDTAEKAVETEDVIQQEQPVDHSKTEEINKKQSAGEQEE